MCPIFCPVTVLRSADDATFESFPTGSLLGFGAAAFGASLGGGGAG